MPKLPFGSSPEAQLQVKNGKAHIYPIAGTFRRSGNDQEDAAIAANLAADEKENAEHVMLVDLARNDMSRNAEHVTVEVFKEIQFYSHVIHLVSKVTGTLKENTSVVAMAADTFPAGTLSGAPKHMAMTLINKYENVNRSLNSSLLFDLRATQGNDGTVARLEVSGGGWGHGVGMCQWGAIGRARAGQSYRDILHAYYTDVGISRLY